MIPGAIDVEHAARSFRVYPRESRALKDLVVARGRVRGSEVWALRDVSFGVEPGSAVGLVGRNGSGKTTLLRLLSGIVKPTSGRLAVGGRIGSLLELGAGFHPDMTGRENVYLNGSIHGLGRAAIREKLDEIVAFAGLEDFIDLPVRTYSSGMYMRLGFAIAAHIEADVLLLDEVFAVGDEAFQRKCFGKIFEFKQRGGTIIFVSHDASAVERLCDRAVLLSAEGNVKIDSISPGGNFSHQRDAVEIVNRILQDLHDQAACIVASANGTFVDLAEREAIRQESPQSIVYSPKSALGESVGASALWQVIVAACALGGKQLPPMLHAARNTGLRFPGREAEVGPAAIVSSCGLNQQAAGLRLST